MGDLSGRTALVTGASGGIGAAVARALVAQGAVVALSGTRVSVLEALQAELGDRARVVPGDLGVSDGPERLVDGCQRACGGIDILVSNAGMTRDGLVMRMTDEDWDQVMAVNLSAAFRLIRGSLRGMMKKRWGRIIAVTSVVAAAGNPGQANYVAAKAGLNGLIKTVAQEVGSRGITANCVAPGFIETEMTAQLPDVVKSRARAAIPVGRAGLPEDVAACVAFLASSEAAYVTGQTLHVNGGMAMI
ncbi:MAG: 3-oxoacyl-ACP reductase FabG [Defluviicoccus sp.]